MPTLQGSRIGVAKGDDAIFGCGSRYWGVGVGVGCFSGVCCCVSWLGAEGEAERGVTLGSGIVPGCGGAMWLCGDVVRGTWGGVTLGVALSQVDCVAPSSA